MKEYPGLLKPARIDYQGLLANLRREGTPERVHHMELFQDTEISNAIIERFDVCPDLDPADPDYEKRKHIAVQRFCGFDYVRVSLEDMEWPLHKQGTADDTATGHDSI